MSTEGFGKSTYNGGGSGFKKPKKLQEGDNIYRIIPPIKSCRNDGDGWAVYHRVHFGYHGVDRNDNTKTKVRPFECVEVKDYRSGIVKVQCAECENIKRWEERKEKVVAEAVASGKSKEEIEALVEPISEYLFRHNTDKKFYLNVMTPKGEFEVLQLSYTTKKKKLDVTIKQLQKEDDQLDVNDPSNGIWLNFHREGKKLDAEDSVYAVYESRQLPDGTKARVIKRSQLTEDQIKQALECPDLNEVTTRISPDQVRMLVESSQDPEDIDRIFALSNPRREESPPARAAAAATAAPLPMTPPAPPAVAQAPKPAPAPAPAADAVDPEEAELERRLAEKRAAKAAAAAKAAVQAASSASGAAIGDPLKMDNADFAKLFPPPPNS